MPVLPAQLKTENEEMTRSFSDIVPASGSMDDDREWNVCRLEDLEGKTLTLVKINFYVKDGEQKVFLGFEGDIAAATGSAPIMDQCRKIRTALEVEEDKTYLPEGVEVKITGKVSAQKRKYFIFE